MMVQVVGDRWQWVFVAADAVVLYFLRGWYKDKIKCADEVEDTTTYELNKELQHTLSQQANKTLPYACVEGSVKALDKPLNSHFNDKEQGVLQKILFVEHKSKRANGYWSDVKKVIKDQVNSRPFALAGATAASPVLVEVTEPLTADFLMDGLTITYDNYVANTDTLLSRGIDRLFGEVSKGYQETEQMLNIGVNMLGIGKLALTGGKIILEPPDDSSQKYILSTLSKKQIIKDLKGDAKTIKVFMWIFGLCGAGLLGYLLYRNFRNIMEHFKMTRMYNEIRDQRRRQDERRTQGGATNTTTQSSHDDQNDLEDNKCVVCLEKPRDVVLLECGHICMCIDCIQVMPKPLACPVCRASVDRYLSVYRS